MLDIKCTLTYLPKFMKSREYPNSTVKKLFEISRLYCTYINNPCIWSPDFCKGETIAVIIYRGFLCKEPIFSDIRV